MGWRFPASKTKPFFVAGQVLAAWSWARWVLGAPGAEPLLINLDETGVPLWMGDVQGNIIRQRGS
jgi:hypothetical protein